MCCWKAGALAVVATAALLGGEPGEVIDWPELQRANQLIQAGRYHEALPVLEREYGRARKVGYKSLDVASILNNLGLVYRKLGHYLKAEKSFRRGLRMKEELGAPAVERVILLLNLATLNADLGRPSRAEEILGRALRLQRDANRSGVMTANILNALGECLRRQEKVAEAEASFSQSVAILRSIGGESHPELAPVYSNLGLLRLEQGRPYEAAKLFERALRAWETTLGPDHPDVAVGLINLGDAQVRLGDTGSAEDSFRRALAITEQRLGKNHPMTAEVLLHYAPLLRQMERKREAKACEKRGRAIFARHAEDNLLNHSVDVSSFQTRRRR